MTIRDLAYEGWKLSSYSILNRVRGANPSSKARKIKERMSTSSIPPGRTRNLPGEGDVKSIPLTRASRTKGMHRHDTNPSLG